MSDTFEVVVAGGTPTRYTDAKEAGAAWFRVDENKDAAVIHTLSKGGARIMAATEIHGQNKDGSNIYVKSLPDSHEVDPAFREGYNEAKAKSLVNSKEVNMDGKTIDAHEPARPLAAELQPTRSPPYAVMQIDDKVVTSIRFERTEKEGAQAYSVSYLMGTKSVMRLRELDAQQLADAVGERNAKSIIEHEEPKGTLKGESLINEQGMSPEAAAKARAAAEAAREAAERENIYLLRTYKGFDKGYHDEKQESLDAAVQSFVKADPDTIPRVVHGKDVVLEYDPEGGILARNKTVEAAYARIEKEVAVGDRAQAPDRENAGRATNTVEPVRDKELELMDGKEVAARAAQLRAGRAQLEQARRDRDELGERAESKRIGVENLSEKAREQDAANDLAEKTGAPGDRRDQLLTEREKNRQIELMELVHSQFRVSGPRYHFKDQPAKVAFKDQGERMVSGSNDDRVAKAMATMAEAKGWKTIKVSGHPEFVREVWMEASLRGLEVRGYKPTEQDKEQLDARRDRAMRNVVEREPERERTGPQREAGTGRAANGRQEADKAAARGEAQPSEEKVAKGPARPFSGRLIEHGEAHYNHDPKEELSYYVKLGTDKGERVVWGVDLKRALDVGKVKTGDEITLEFKGKQPVTVRVPDRDKDGRVVGTKEIETTRNSWDVQKSDRHKVAEAVASAVIDASVQSPAQRTALKAAIGARLAERDQAGKVPAVHVYDKAAPSRARERSAPVVERNSERTRSR